MSDIALPGDRLAARSRWLRRYGLASFGAAVILVWVARGDLRTVAHAATIRTSSMSPMRLRPPSASTGSAPTRWGATW